MRESLAAYALGALPPDEAEAVRRHVCGCAECAPELAGYGRMRDGLNLAVPDAPLPPGFHDRLMARARPVRALPAVSRPAARRRDSRLPWALLAASLLIALLLGGRAWQLDRELDRRQAELDRAQAPLAGVVDFLGQPGVEARDLPDPGSPVRTRLYQSRRGGAAMVVFDDMRPLPEGRVYQLWLEEGDALKSIATFEPNGKGNWFTVLNPPEGIAAYDRVCVTVEPEGGSPRPTTKWTVWAKL